MFHTTNSIGQDCSYAGRTLYFSCDFKPTDKYSLVEIKSLKSWVFACPVISVVWNDGRKTCSGLFEASFLVLVLCYDQIRRLILSQVISLVFHLLLKISCQACERLSPIIKSSVFKFYQNLLVYGSMSFLIAHWLYTHSSLYLVHLASTDLLLPSEFP